MRTVGYRRDYRKVATALKEKHMLVVAAILLGVSLAAGPLAAQEDVRLRKGDAVRLDVPQRDDLGRVLTIDAKGDISLPIVGAIHVEGLTLEEAKSAVLRSVQEVYPSVQTVSVSLIGEEARRVIYVQGQVARPGKYEIGGTPSVWEAIKEAGGALAGASLESAHDGTFSLSAVPGPVTITIFSPVSVGIVKSTTCLFSSVMEIV